MSQSIEREQRVFAILFLIIAVFAVIASLFTWGSGYLFSEEISSRSLLPIVDLLVTFPLSVLSGIYLLKNRSIGYILGLVLAGTLLFGSVAVYVSIYIENEYNLELFIPPISGILLGFSYVYWISTRIDLVTPSQSHKPHSKLALDR